MSDNDIAIIEFPKYNKSKYDLRDGLFSFHETREDEGQRKYGAGRKNAGYRRDNLLDVLEELSDAVVILGYFTERWKKVGAPDDRWDIDIAIRAHKVSGTIIDLMNEVAELRDKALGYYPSLGNEDVKRVAPLGLE